MYKVCANLGLRPAEIRSEDENEAALRLDKKIKKELNDNNVVVLLGATDQVPKRHTWYWISQVYPQHPSPPVGAPIFTVESKAPYIDIDGSPVKPDGTDFQKFPPQSYTFRNVGLDNCIHFEEYNGDVIWKPVSCGSKNFMCEAGSISGVSVDMSNLRSLGTSPRDLEDL